MLYVLELGFQKRNRNLILWCKTVPKLVGFDRFVKETKRLEGGGLMEVNQRVQGGRGRPLSREISEVRAVQQQRELRLNSTYQNLHPRSFDQGGPRPCSDVLARKEEIFMKAGRLAAEYLVSRGLLSPSLLPRNQTDEEQERLKGKKDREVLEGRTTSTRTQTRQTTAPQANQTEVDQGDDSDFDPLWPWYQTYMKGRKPNARGSGLDQQRNHGRSGQSVEKSPWNPDTDDDDFPPPCRKSSRRRLAESGDSVSRNFKHDQFTRGRVKRACTSERGNSITKNNVRSKAASGRTRMDHPQEANRKLYKVGSNAGSVAVDKLKGNMSSVLEKKGVRMDDRRERMHENSLLKQIGPAEVPKRHRSILVQRKQKFALVNGRPTAKAKSTSKAALKGVSKSRRFHASESRTEKENFGMIDDIKSKARFSQTGKDHQPERNLDVGKLDDDGKVLDPLETDSGNHSKKKDVLVEDKTLTENDNDLSKLISFPKMHKRPRSLLAKRNRPIDLVSQGHTESKSTLEAPSQEAFKDPMEEGSSLSEIKSFVDAVDSAILPIKKRDKASLLQPKKNMDGQYFSSVCAHADDKSVKVSSSGQREHHLQEVVEDNKGMSSLKIDSSGDLETKKDADQAKGMEDIEPLKFISSLEVGKKPRTIGIMKPRYRLN